MEVRGPQLLLVDDDAMVRRSWSRLLEAKGFAVSAVAGTAEAIAALEAIAFDVVLCDLNLPGTDGLLLLKQVLQRWPKTRRVLMSGSHCDHLGRTSDADVVHAFVLKTAPSSSILDALLPREPA